MNDFGKIQDQKPPWYRATDGRLFAVLVAIMLFCLAALYVSLQHAEKFLLRSEALEVAPLRLTPSNRVYRISRFWLPNWNLLPHSSPDFQKLST